MPNNMLLSSDYSIEKSIAFNFAYDNGEVKQVKLSIGDIAEITYNGGRIRKSITGKITRIEAGNETVTHPVHVCHEPYPVNCEHYHWWIMIDGSEYNASKTERIDCKRILDINLLAGANSSASISSPVGSMRVTDFRVDGGYLQLSMDNRQTWINVCKMEGADVKVNPHDQKLADRIADMLPNGMNPGDRADLILGMLDLIKEIVAAHHKKSKHHHHKDRDKVKEKLIDDVIKKIQDSGVLDDIIPGDVASRDEVMDMLKDILGEDFFDDEDLDEIEDPDPDSEEEDDYDEEDV